MSDVADRMVPEVLAMRDEMVRLRERVRELEVASAAGVSEPVSNAYTLPPEISAVVAAAKAYEKWQGKWYDYTVASGEKPAKQQRALIEAVRALTAASEGASA